MEGDSSEPRAKSSQESALTAPEHTYSNGLGFLSHTDRLPNSVKESSDPSRDWV